MSSISSKAIGLALPSSFVTSEHRGIQPGLSERRAESPVCPQLYPLCEKKGNVATPRELKYGWFALHSVLDAPVVLRSLANVQTTRTQRPSASVRCRSFGRAAQSLLPSLPLQSGRRQLSRACRFHLQGVRSTRTLTPSLLLFLLFLVFNGPVQKPFQISSQPEPVSFLIASLILPTPSCY